MRMWMVDPKLLCRQHLLGEHVEIHMVAGSLMKYAQWESLLGLARVGFIEVHNLDSRHAELVAEMLSRGYKHSSPLDSSGPRLGSVDRSKSLVDLYTRCPDCRSRIYSQHKEWVDDWIKMSNQGS